MDGNVDNHTHGYAENDMDGNAGNLKDGILERKT